MYNKLKNNRPEPKKEGSLNVFKFEKHNLPTPFESLYKDDNQIVYYGVDNQYPSFLLKLFNESSIHSAIINTKTTYIIGAGLKVNDSDINVNVNAQDSFQEFIGKVVKDYLIFGYFFVEVVYNAFNEPIEYFHIPAQCVRTNKLKDKFWYSEDWAIKRKMIEYYRWRLNNNDSTSKIFFYDGYNPSINQVYSQPDYNGSIKSIVTDIAIKDFNLNQIKNHFSLSTLVTFFNGNNLTDEVKKQVNKELKEVYSGENGAKLIVSFESSEGKAADVKNISAGDWDKAFVEVAKAVADDIYRGHQCTSPLLFGVKTEGQLGGNTELETAYSIFKNTYVVVKRAELESAFNLLFSNSTLIKGKLSFKDKPLFSTQISDVLKEKIYTINEMRKEAGLPPLANGDRLLNESPAPSNNFEEESEDDEPIIDKKKGQLKRLTDEDFEKVKHFGRSKQDFEVIKQGKFVFNQYEATKLHLQFDLEQDIADYLVNNDIKNMTIDDIVAELKDKGIDISSSDLKETITKLNESGLLKATIEDGEVTVKPNKQADIPDTGKIQVMYEYVLRDEVDGPDLLPTSRGFCRKLINNDKFYSREDIQTMSSIFEYDVFAYGGGWYNSPDGPTPYCRHKFKSVTVRLKENDNN